MGDGPERRHLERDLPEALFCGVQRGETLAAHYASGDLFLFPSLSETFGNVVLEAQAAGLAVVAFDQAAAGQHIRHGHNGVLAAPGDKSGFVEVASWLLDDPGNACAGSVSTPANTPAGKVGTVSSSTSRTARKTPAPVRWSSPLGRSPSGRRQRMAGPCHAAASSSQAKAFGVAMKPRLMAPAPRLMPPVGLSMPRCKWMSRSRQAFSNAAKPGRSRSAVGSPA